MVIGSLRGQHKTTNCDICTEKLDHCENEYRFIEYYIVWSIDFDCMLT